MVNASPRHARRPQEYNSWVQMRQRCNNPNDKKFRLYGGRGIKVCERWNDFANFLADMGPRPSPGHSIDRYPDNMGNYEPGNCRWATPMEQANNRPGNRLIAIDGETITIAEASRRTGIHKSTIRSRLESRAATVRADRGRKLTAADVIDMRSQIGVPHRELARRFGIDKKTVAQIVRRQIWRHI